MSRGEWQSIMVMLGAILFVLILNLCYLRFIWDILFKFWNRQELLYDQETAQFYLGDPARRKPGVRPRNLHE